MYADAVRTTRPARLAFALAVVACAAAVPMRPTTVHAQAAGQRAADEAACAKAARANVLANIACMIGRGHPMLLEANGARIELRASFRGETDLVLSDIRLCESEAKIEEPEEDRRARVRAGKLMEPQLAVFMDCMTPRGYTITPPRPAESR